MAATAGSGDPGLDAFDAANPDFAARVAAASYVGGPGYNYYQDALINYRYAHGTYYHPSTGVWSDQQARAFSFYAGQEGAQWPSSLPGQSIGGVPYADQHAWSWSGDPGASSFGGLKDGGLVGFNSGGAIMPGRDQQVVKFRKNPEEMVSIFTPHQMDVVRDALRANQAATAGDGGMTVKNGDFIFQIASADPRVSAREIEARIATLFQKWSNGRIR
jgi:hypothetical protein